MDQIKDKLYPFQITHVNNLVRIIKNNIAAADTSDTGVGKTYTAIATCKILNLRPIILCPKSVLRSWQRVADLFGVKTFFVVNYETIKFGKYYSKKARRIKCPYIDVIKNSEKNESSEYT